MAKLEPKTRPNCRDVDAFLNSVTEEQQLADSFKLLDIFKDITSRRAENVGLGRSHKKEGLMFSISAIGSLFAVRL